MRGVHELHPFGASRRVGELEFVDETLVTLAYAYLALDRGGGVRQGLARLHAVDVHRKFAGLDSERHLRPGRRSDIGAGNAHIAQLGRELSGAQRQLQ